MSSYVIAGVTGHVGSVVASELLARGEKIKAIVRDANRASAWRERGADIVVGSLCDNKFLAKTLVNTAGFFTLLPQDCHAGDFYGAQRRTADSIAAAVKESAVPHVVMLSSLGADLVDGTGPIKGLHYLERALAAAGTKLTAVRACFFRRISRALFPRHRTPASFRISCPRPTLRFQWSQPGISAALPPKC